MSNNMNLVLDHFTAVVNEQILTPITAYLQNRGVNVTLQELQGVIGVKVHTPTMQAMPSIASLPTGITTNLVPRPVMPSMGGIQQQPMPGTCIYKFTRSPKQPGRVCGKACVDGTTYCKACWLKQTVQKEARDKGIPIPQCIIDAANKKSATASASNVGVRTTTMPSFPTLPTVPVPMANGIPSFNATAGRIQMPLPTANTLPPTAPVQSNNPYQVTNTESELSMDFLDQRMPKLGMLPNEWSIGDNYLIGANNIVYIAEEGDQPTKAIGVLDINSRSFRPLMEHEMSLVLADIPYDPTMLPTRKSVQPSLPTMQPSLPTMQPMPMMLPSNTVGVPKLPTTLQRTGLPTMLQPPKSNIIASNEEEE